MQYLFEHFAVAVSAISGVLAARGKQVDLFGVVVLALVTALGGGTIRDLSLGLTPVFWIQDTRYLITAAVTAVALFYIVRFHEPSRNILLVADAFALALFTILGAKKSLTVSSAASIAVAMGVITGVAGGILRDLLIGEIPLVFRREIYLYATAAFCGASSFLLLHGISSNPRANMLCGMAMTLALRLAGMRWKIALPMFRPRNDSGVP